MKKLFPLILENTLIADNIFKLVLEDNFPQEEFKPGKFLHVKCSKGIDPLLRRPMSICDISDDESRLTVIYRKEGHGTSLLSEFKAGERLDILAPLGNHFEINFRVSENVEVAVPLHAPGVVLLVGGGIGVPPLYYLGRKLKAMNFKIISILGFNSKKDIFYEAEFSNLGKTYISTVDGTYGEKGFVTDVLKQIADTDYDLLYSCGPKAMLKALQLNVKADKTAYMSLEERMGCGVGACLACVCNYAEDFKRDKAYSRVCTEGPVYELHEIAL